MSWLASKDIARSYIQDLAAAFEIEVTRSDKRDLWIVTIDGKAPSVQHVADKFDRWPDVIARFQRCYFEYIEHNGV